MQDAIATLKPERIETAARLVFACGEAFDSFNRALLDVESRVGADEFRQLKQAVGAVVGGEMFDLRTQLVELYPELDVDDPRQLVRMYEGGRNA